MGQMAFQVAVADHIKISWVDVRRDFVTVAKQKTSHVP